MVKFFKHYSLSLRIFWWGVYKIFLDAIPKIKIIICKVFEQYSITFKNIWGGLSNNFRLQKYDREQSMFQNCTIQMLMDQQNIIRKQRETIEKKNHQLTKLKQKHTKTTEELEKKTETTKQTEEIKKKFQNPLPSVQRQDI